MYEFDNDNIRKYNANSPFQRLVKSRHWNWDATFFLTKQIIENGSVDIIMDVFLMPKTPRKNLVGKILVTIICKQTHG